MITDWISIVVTAVVAIVGYYLANSYHRQTRTTLAEARRTAYARLWEITGLAKPTRLDLQGLAGALTEFERRRLFALMTEWYYEDGNGMLLDRVTREVYLAAKHNLICSIDDLRPRGILCYMPAENVSDPSDQVTLDQLRGCMSIRQLSLLRTQMKSDLAIYGLPYVGQLAAHERAFLRHCQANLRRRPWRGAVRGRAEVERCGERANPASED